MRGKKTGGRTPGAKNHKTSEIKQWVKTILETNQAQFESDLETLEPKDRVQIYERLLKYAIAPLQALSPEALQGQTSLRHTDLVQKVMELGKVKIDAAKKRITEAKNKGLIIQNDSGLYYLKQKGVEDVGLPF